MRRLTKLKQKLKVNMMIKQMNEYKLTPKSYFAMTLSLILGTVSSLALAMFVSLLPVDPGASFNPVSADSVSSSISAKLQSKSNNKVRKVRINKPNGQA